MYFGKINAFVEHPRVSIDVEKKVNEELKEAYQEERLGEEGEDVCLM